MPLQITFDCADPHAQAAFWEVAMDDFEAESHHDIVQGAIDGGFVTPDSDDVETVDGRYRWRDMAALRNATGDRLLFARVPEPKTAKNRVHLDLHVDDRAAKLEQLYARGATHLWDAQVGPQSWVTIADPEGNELCVS